MNFKQFWFGHSLVWIGVLYSNPGCATAETTLPPAPNPDLQEADRLSSPVDMEADSHLNSALAVPNVAPPETFSPLRNRLNSIAQSAHSDTTAVAQSSHSIVIDSLLLVKEEVQSSKNSHSQEEVPTQPLVPHSDTSEPLNVEPDLEPMSEEAPAQTEAVEEQEDEQETDATTAIDPELGRLRLRERELERELAIEEDTETVFLTGRVDYFRSDNILLDDFDPIDDQSLRAGISLLAVPDLGPQTQLFASVGGNVVRYDDLSELDYQDLEIRAEIQQVLFPRTYGRLGWSNRQFFSADDGDRFLNDHSVRLSLSRRDPLAPQLTLDSFYQLRLSFADPVDRSRVAHTLGTALSYSLQPDLEVELDYQLVLTDFTQEEREDAYHQVTAQLSYDLSNNSRVRLFAGLSFGRSSKSDVDFDSSVAGIVFDTFLPLF